MNERIPPLAFAAARRRDRRPFAPVEAVRFGFCCSH